MPSQRLVLTLSIAPTQSLDYEFACVFIRAVSEHPDHEWKVVPDLLGDVVLYEKGQVVQAVNAHALLIPLCAHVQDTLDMLVLPTDVDQVLIHVEQAIACLNQCGHKVQARLSQPLGAEAWAAMTHSSHVLHNFSQSIGEVFTWWSFHQLAVQREQAIEKRTKVLDAMAMTASG